MTSAFFKMKLLTAAILVSLLSISSGSKSCRIMIDAHDRSSMYSRNFIGGQSNRWPQGVIPYNINRAFNFEQREIIESAMAHISERTCVRFVERSGQKGYVDIVTGRRGCYANLGYSSRRGRHLLHLEEDGCVSFGTVVHELLHILGFGHEQTRPDRDDFVKIHWNNIVLGTYSNFWRALGESENSGIPFCRNVAVEDFDNCHSGLRTSTFGIGYDYGSIMHYGLNAFSKNNENTISLRKEWTQTLPNTSAMSQLDIEKIMAAYDCTNWPSSTQPSTQNCRNLLQNGRCSKLEDYCQYDIIKKYCPITCGNC